MLKKTTHGQGIPEDCRRNVSLGSSERVKRKVELQNSGIRGSVDTPARFNLDQHRTGVGSRVTTAWCTLKTPG